MDKYYCFAGVEVVVSIADKWMYEDERELEDFRVSHVKNPHVFHFEIVDKLAVPKGQLVADYPDYCVYMQEEEQIRYIGSMNNGWESAYLRILHQEKEHFVQIKKSGHMDKVYRKLVLNALNLEQLVVKAQGVILHASYIEFNGKAILFTAPSGTGKSTQAELWQRYRNAEIINGDRVVIRLIDGKVYAAGIPFAGSSEFCKNQELPLEAIVYLQQAPHTEIERLKGFHAFRKVWEGCTVNTWNQKDLNKAVDLVTGIVGTVPVYHLACTPDESAIIALEQKIERSGK